MDVLENIEDGVLEAAERTEDDVEEQVRIFCDSITAVIIGRMAGLAQILEHFMSV